MIGTITRYRRRKRRKHGTTVTYGYYFKAGGKQFSKGGFETKEAAQEALKAAIATQTDTPVPTPRQRAKPRRAATRGRSPSTCGTGSTSTPPCAARRRR
jgi:hypothetical protein